MNLKLMNTKAAAFLLAFMMVESGSALAATAVLSGVSGNICSYTSYSADASGNLSVTCAETDPPPTPTAPSCILTASPSTINAGSSTNLNANCSPAATSFAWTGTSFTGNGGAVNPTSTTTYSVIGTNNFGAGNTATVVVTVTTGNGGIGTRTVPPTPQSPLADIRAWNYAFETKNNIPHNLKAEAVGYMAYLKVIQAGKPTQIFLPIW
ncbi:MAG: hypothetical protein DID92_2727745078 [Candidatus Nitrotoga sp. SPKER]|nr:MAG: hypothetical protein DID92_2727745078 [Candidatus Nitrotoga sp. SPKER]